MSLLLDTKLANIFYINEFIWRFKIMNMVYALYNMGLEVRKPVLAVATKLG